MIQFSLGTYHIVFFSYFSHDINEDHIPFK